MIINDMPRIAHTQSGGPESADTSHAMQNQPDRAFTPTCFNFCTFRLSVKGRRQRFLTML
jgi:hypothetical protein